MFHIDCPRVKYEEFNDAVEGSLESEGYMIVADQVTLLNLVHMLQYHTNIEDI
jgi:hypothetical protein